MQLFNNFNSNNKNNSMPFTKHFFNRIAKSAPIKVDEEINNNTNVNEQQIDNLRARWGPSTWFLFHTLAHKIKSEDFSKLKTELIDIIKGICNNLPCPTCSTHASQYVKNLNYNSINSKEDLKIFLFNFHNDVNRRRNVDLFSLSELDEKYSKANTINVIKNFVLVFQYKNKSFNMIANEMQRQRQLDLFRVWINANYNSFDM